MVTKLIGKIGSWFETTNLRCLKNSCGGKSGLRTCYTKLLID